MICPKCQVEVSERSKFCGRCGASLSGIPAISVSVPSRSVRCSFCGSEELSGVRFCRSCGRAIPAEASSGPAERSSAATILSATAAVVLLLLATAWFIFGSRLHNTKPAREDLIYIPSFQGAGLIEIHPGQPTVRRVAKTTGFNNALVSYNPLRNEFYVGLTNGDHVAIIDGNTFTQTGKLVEDVGWNTSGVELSHDGSLVVVTGSDAKVLLFDTQTQKLKRRINVQGGRFPTYALFSSDDHTLFVSSGDSISAFDPRTLQLRGWTRLPGWQPSPMAGNSDGTLVFFLQRGRLIRLSAQSLAVLDSRPLPEDATNFLGSRLQISRDGGAIWVGGIHGIYRVNLSLRDYTMVTPPEPPVTGIGQYCSAPR